MGVAGGALIALLSGCSVHQAFAFGWPQGGVTPQSARMFNLWIGSVIAALAVGVLVWGLIFWCVIRYRKRGDQPLPVQTRFNLPIELIYTVAPVLVISVLFYYTAIIQTDVNKITPNPDVTVNVDAFKWNWKFSYPDTMGPDGQPVYTIGTDTTIPILVLPTNRTILFIEHSSDVIHSFWVPEMLFKRDVFPGNVTNQLRDDNPANRRLRRAVRRAVRHVPLDDELRGTRGDAGEVRPVPRGEESRADHRPGTGRYRRKPDGPDHRAVPVQAHRRHRVTRRILR